MTEQKNNNEQREQDFGKYSIPEKLWVLHNQQVFMSGCIEGLSLRIKRIEKELGVIEGKI